MFSLRTGWIFLAALVLAMPASWSQTTLASDEPIKFFHSLYVDGVVTQLTGVSSMQQYTFGARKGAYGVYGQIQNAWSDTHGSDALYQYSARGLTISAGLRYWLPGEAWYGFAQVGHVLTGNSKGTDEERLGLAGFNEWDFGKKKDKVLDFYGDLTWVNNPDTADTYLTMRVRDGKVLHQEGNSRLWAYGVGQLNGSASGSNGINNRIEAGVGLGYRTYQAPFGMNASFELREGYSFQGVIAHKTYFNPTFIISGGF